MAIPRGIMTAVGGDRLEGTIADFTRRCGLLLGEEVERPVANNALVSVLCDSIRLAREHCALATGRTEREVRVATLVEAAKLTCCWCEEGKPIRRGKDLGGFWLAHEFDEHGDVEKCEAQEIIVLLVKENWL